MSMHRILLQQRHDDSQGEWRDGATHYLRCQSHTVGGQVVPVQGRRAMCGHLTIDESADIAVWASQEPASCATCVKSETRWSEDCARTEPGWAEHWGAHSWVPRPTPARKYAPEPQLEFEPQPQPQPTLSEMLPRAIGGFLQALSDSIMLRLEDLEPAATDDANTILALAAQVVREAVKDATP